MNILLCMPTYGPIDPQTMKSILVAVAHAAKHGHPLQGVLNPDRLPHAAARNIAVESIINKDECAESVIFWCDSDMVLPPDAITRLVESGKDFITGIYFQRGGDHRPLVATFDTNKKRFNWLAKWPENVTAPIDGCGFGCVLTSVKMLREMKAPWFEYLEFSEDFDFCLKAQKAGYQLYVDTGILCGHLMDPQPATIETYVNKNSKFKLEVHNGTVRTRDQSGNVDYGANPENGSVREAAMEQVEFQPR